MLTFLAVLIAPVFICAYLNTSIEALMLVEALYVVFMFGGIIELIGSRFP